MGELDPDANLAPSAIGQKKLKRDEEKKKQADEHKKRLAALKAKGKKKVTSTVKSRFANEGVNSAFMANAKKEKDAA